MTVTIKTNNQWRDLVYRSDVPAGVLRDQFDHLSEEEVSDGFFFYRNYWYHISDFMRIEHNEALKGWDGYSSDSYFSGVVIKLSSDGEQYMAGTYFS